MGAVVVVDVSAVVVLEEDEVDGSDDIDVIKVVDTGGVMLLTEEAVVDESEEDDEDEKVEEVDEVEEVEEVVGDENGIDEAEDDIGDDEYDDDVNSVEDDEGALDVVKEHEHTVDEFEEGKEDVGG